MKRLLSIQDISCVGKCSLTVALPVISAMGVEAAVLPTALLSTHTAFASPAFRDLTEDILPIADHWQQLGITFDGICTGYLGAGAQADAVMTVFEKFKDQGTLLFVDPVMGDSGRLYDRIDSAFILRMRQLCEAADVIVPNVTEACYLTDEPYRETYGEDHIKKLLQKLTACGIETVLITGVSFREGSIGVMGHKRSTGEYFLYEQQELPQRYHGTGDIFSAVCAGALTLGQDWKDAAKLAADFTAACIRATAEEDRDKRFGVCFEKALPQLFKRIR